MNKNTPITSTTNTQDPYLKPCFYTIRLIERLKSLDTKNKLNFDIINKSIYWARKYHGSQIRKSGEPFYTHPLEVAYLISEHNLTTNVIVTSILHDIIEDTEVTFGMILDNFGWRITEMVDALTRDRPDGTKLSVEEILTNAYKKRDNEVLLIKLVDRIHNLSTIDSKSPEKIRKTINNTIENFVALTMYLNLIDHERCIVEICKFFSNNEHYPRPAHCHLLKRSSHLKLAPVFQNEISQIYNQK